MKKILALLFALLATPAGAQIIPSGPFGSINYWGPSGQSVNLVPGLAGFCLTSGGTGQPVAWSLCPGATLASLPSINTNQFYGNVSGNFQAPIGVDVNTILNTVGYDIARPPAVESILYKSNVGPTFNWQTLPPATQGSILTSGGPTNPPFWATNPIQANLAGVCTTVGAVLYFDTPSLQWKCLSPGTSGQLLQTGGAAGNPSWLTVTLATLGGVPSTRNVNTTSPLGGGGALSSDLTLTCTTCATTTNGGALSATSPLSISAGGAISITNPLPIANGGTNATTAPNALINLFPTPTRAGDIAYWNGTNFVLLAGNNSGTNVLTENPSGVPSWAAPGTGTVTSVTCGTGLSGGTFTTTGTCALALNSATLQASPANPAAFTSATPLMEGLGTTCKITPVYSTRVWLDFQGIGSNANASNAFEVQARFGTGVAPANAAVPAGTTVGSLIIGFQATANYLMPFKVGGLITGLTPGTAYWFDIAASNNGAGAVALSGISCAAMEF